jgi:hypothetical protein
MSPESFKRKFTAILSADVKGYGRLMGKEYYFSGLGTPFNFFL